jgi:uncharacterized protein YbaR (Trm112 family)
MNKDLLKVLACPICKGKLEYHQDSNVMICNNDQLLFTVNGRIAVLLEMEAKKSNSNENPSL